ncbi:MAG: ParB/RepB/Spo0J family partition protein, partial [Acidobacteria bacterium]
MAEFHPAVTPFRPAAPAHKVDDFDENDAAAARVEAERPPLREGLPPGYRMRADAHYVDQVVGRSHGEAVQVIPIGKIDGPYPSSGTGLEQLVRSVARHGILQPLIVRRKAGRYDLIAGARRLAAATAAGLTEVPCLVRTADDAACRELADAANVRVAGTAPVEAARVQPATAQAFPALMEHLGSISACLHLFAERDRPMRERVAFGLIRAEVHRAAWLAQALAVLHGRPTPARSPVDVRAAVRRVASAMEPERQLSGVDIDIRLGAPASVLGDETLITVAVAGLIIAVQALVEHAGGSRVRVSVDGNGPGTARIEVAPDGVVLPAAASAALLDPGWHERPGGAAAGTAVAAAQRIATLLGGRLYLGGKEFLSVVLEL